jgi:pentatricopeptide repeat protein
MILRQGIGTRTVSTTSILPNFQQLSGTTNPTSTPAPILTLQTQGRRRKLERRLTTQFDISPPSTSSTFFSVPPVPFVPQISSSRYLPLITRERNYLLSLFHLEIHGSTRNPDKVWTALTRLLQYPTIQPELPRSYHATPETSLALDDYDKGEVVLDTRSTISLSLPELRRTFTIFSSTRPPTRAGLSKLIVIVELLAMRSSITLPAITDGGGEGVESGGRDKSIENLRGGGVGLRSRDWEALIYFASRCYRSPRATHEIASTTSLFSQWTQQRKSANGTLLMTPMSVYNNLIYGASKARSWGLIEAVQERMKEEGVEGDSYTHRIMMGVEEMRGGHIEIMWNLFLRGIQRCLDNQTTGQEMKVDKMSYEQRKEWIGLWNHMVWIYAKRGLLIEAMKMYTAMNEGKGINLRDLAPPMEVEIISSSSTEHVYLIIPPSPSAETHGSLIQSFAYTGDLKSALSILRTMLNPPHHHRHHPISPLPTPPQTLLLIYLRLFRGFASHGESPIDSSYQPINTILYSGQRVGPNRTTSNLTFDTLRRFTASSSSSSSSSSQSSGNGELVWSIEILETLFKAFLQIPPPPPSSSSSSSSSSSTTPLAIQSTAPSPKLIWWVLLAFDKLSAGDTERVLKVWKGMERTFKEGEEGGGGGGWKGWRMDSRIKRTIEKLEKRRRGEREEEERREREREDV